VLHFRPATVPQKTLHFSLTWGLGGMAALLVAMQLATGLLLKFVYVPTPAAAYGAMQALLTEVPFGRLIRNLHHWCAHLLVLVVFLHMLRVFFTGAFHPPRQFNWIIGAGQFALILLANFTGYLLPWDQLAFWAVTVSTGMLEYIPWIGPRLQQLLLTGTDLGPGALHLFFALHTAVLPVLIIGLMGFHFWRIRRAGGLVIPRLPGQAPDARPQRVNTLPDLLLRETTAALVLIAAVLLFSILVNAPLGDPANAGLSPNPTRAPWYFAGLQEMLLHLHPVFAICILPLFFVLLLAIIPYLEYDYDSGGVWFVSPKGRRLAAWTAASALVATPAIVILKEMVLPPAESFFYNGILPFILIVAVMGIVYGGVRRRLQASRNEAVQTLFVFLIVSFAVLTAVNVWFRGAGMQLTMPW
jgi:quinol-cytochrome oxidoreductase complex cytochrome b subunit